MQQLSQGVHEVCHKVTPRNKAVLLSLPQVISFSFPQTLTYFCKFYVKELSFVGTAVEDRYILMPCDCVQWQKDVINTLQKGQTGFKQT